MIELNISIKIQMYNDFLKQVLLLAYSVTLLTFENQFIFVFDIRFDMTVFISHQT